MLEGFIAAHKAGVPEGAMDRLGYSESPFLKHQEDLFPSDDWYFTFHTIAATSVYLLRMTKKKPLFQFHFLRNAEIKGLHVRTSNHKVAILFNQVYTQNWFLRNERQTSVSDNVGHKDTNSRYNESHLILMCNIGLQAFIYFFDFCMKIFLQPAEECHLTSTKY